MYLCSIYFNAKGRFLTLQDQLDGLSTGKGQFSIATKSTLLAILDHRVVVNLWIAKQGDTGGVAEVHNEAVGTSESVLCTLGAASWTVDSHVC